MRKVALVLFVLLCSFLHSADWLESSSPHWKCYKKETLDNLGSLPGWCSHEKAEKMMDLILEVRPTVCVEIGVFGGSSVYPTARALNYLLHGRLYCIDPWLKQPPLDGYTTDNPHFQWWSQINHDEMLNGFLKMLSDRRLANRCAVLRMKSEEAVFWFEDESIDILHIDGNHTELAALQDARLFLPKVKKGGYIWFDDTDWPSTLAAQKALLEQCVVIEERSVGRNCMLFKKNIK